MDTAIVFTGVCAAFMLGGAIRDGMKAIAAAIVKASELSKVQRSVILAHVDDLEECAKEFERHGLNPTAKECREAAKTLLALIG